MNKCLLMSSLYGIKKESLLFWIYECIMLMSPDNAL